MPILGDEFIAELRIRLIQFMQWLAAQVPLVLILGAILAVLITLQQIILSLLHGLL